MIDLLINTQPDDESCGPTCLHAVYNHYGYKMNLNDIVKSVERSYSGGTLAPYLGKHALENGFDTIIYVSNLEVFDPTWFKNGVSINKEILAKLNTQLKYKTDVGITKQTLAYQKYLQSGGEIHFRNISVSLLKKIFNRKIPILTGLSATFLYNCAREFYKNGHAIYDDIRGTPCGHFVILCGYDEKRKNVVVADPHRSNPLSQDNYYKVGISRLINAIMLGVLTLDGNLLIIQPKKDLNANHFSH